MAALEASARPLAKTTPLTPAEKENQIKRATMELTRITQFQLDPKQLIRDLVDAGGRTALATLAVVMAQNKAAGRQLEAARDSLEQSEHALGILGDNRREWRATKTLHLLPLDVIPMAAWRQTP